MISYTKHAEMRAQQRSIPPLIVDWLFRFGHLEHRGKREIYFFDKAAKKEIKKTIGSLPYKRLKDQLNAYAVVSMEGEIITLAKRYQKKI